MAIKKRKINSQITEPVRPLDCHTILAAGSIISEKQSRSRWPMISREQRFWNKVKKSEGCWLWTAGKLHGGPGYGQFDRGIPAHRVAWEFSNGKIPHGIFVLHKCDNPPCVNPEHLFLGTQRDNMDDKMRKNRQAIGSDIGTSKLTEADVVEIIRLYPDFNQYKLAKKFGVSQSNISFIIKGERWKHIRRIQHV